MNCKGVSTTSPSKSNVLSLETLLTFVFHTIGSKPRFDNGVILAISMQNDRRMALSLVALFVLSTMMPLVSAGEENDSITSSPSDDYSVSISRDLPLTELLYKDSTQKSSTGGRAACVTQTDAGIPGDAGNNSATSRSLGNDPNSGQTGNQGCVDSTDTEDWYEITTTAGKDVDIELVVPSGADFDLYLIDSSGTYLDSSESVTSLEKVTTQSTSLSGVSSTFYVEVFVYSGDGQYSLRTWTNNTPPRPDLTISSVTEPASGQAGSTVSVEYVVENIYNTTSDAFEVQFVLSTDQTYDFGDELIDASEPEAALAENTSRTTTAQVLLPTGLSNGTYYWLLFADGYDNLTEQNESNNFLWSSGVMLVGDSCDDLHPNGKDDAGLGGDAPSEEANVTAPLGTNVTATYTGCIDGVEANDVFSFDVPANHTIDVTLSLEESVVVSLDLTDSNSAEVDSSTAFFGGDATVTSSEGAFDGIGGTYYINLSRSGTGVNWTLEVWTNYSTPKANLVIENSSSPLQASAGDTIDIDVEVLNSGTIPAPASILTAWLSVDIGLADHDVELGNLTLPSIDVNVSDMYQLSVTVPASTTGGNYSIIVMVDSDEQIDEKIEDDNMVLTPDEILIDTKEVSCASQDDAASGGDAGEDESTAIVLGLDVSMTLTGCIHKDVDDDDWYEIEVSPGLNVTATLINSADQDADLVLRNNAGNAIDSSYLSASNDEFVSTSSTTSYAGTGGTFYLSVQSWLSLGVYTLVIETEGVDLNNFNCGQPDDVGLGQDAPAGSGINIGQNPTVSGQGCFSGVDELDVFAFTVNDGKNFEIEFDADTVTAMTATLEDTNGNFIAEVDNTSFGLMFNSYGTDYEGKSTDLILTVRSGGSAGFYNLTVTPLDSAPADIAVSSLVCPTNHTSGSEVQITWELVSLRGDAESTSILVHLDLLDETGTKIDLIAEETIVVNGVYNTTFGSKLVYYTTNDEQASGTYSCRLTIDVDDSLIESNETNNEFLGDSFFIQNEQELWANDVDRDGFNTTDTGDGIIDDCPTTYGDSTIDRVGCADLDGDGVSNLNDLWPFDSSQALDSDGDSYGDNTSGIDGDACPEVAGVANGVGGAGCPPESTGTDADNDGVDDSIDDCPSTPAGTIVGEDGCEVDDNSNVGEPIDPVDNTSTNTNQTVDDDNSNSSSTDDGTVDTDDTQSDSTVLGMDPLTLGLVGAALLILVLAVLAFTRRRSSPKEDKMFEQQQAAFANVGNVPLQADPTITAEQLAYEQQLIASGYPADYARAYADQHFRPWLKN